MSASRAWIHWLLAAGFAAAVAISTKASDGFLTGKKRPYELPPLVEVDPRFLDVLTLGSKNVYDDFIHIWLLQDLMAEHKPGDYAPLKRLIDAVVRQKPRIESLYMLSCFILDQDFGRAEDCKPIIMTGLEVFPQSWRLPMTAGFMEAFKLHRYAEAAAFYFMASSRASSPPYVASLARKLASREDLSEDDINRSLEILMQAGQRSKFQELLRQHAKTPDDGQAKR